MTRSRLLVSVWGTPGKKPRHSVATVKEVKEEKLTPDVSGHPSIQVPDSTHLSSKHL